MIKRIDLLTSDRRPETTQATVEWWQAQGWEVVCWDNTGNPPGVGRNRILEDFYSSPREWLVMADDDTTLYTHRFRTQEFLDCEWQTQTDVDLFCLMSNQEMSRGFHYTWWDTKEFNNQWVFKLEPAITKFYCLRNTGTEIYQQEWMGLEDFDFAMEYLKAGYTTARLMNVFLREQGYEKSSLFTDYAHRKECYEQGKANFNKKWGTSRKQTVLDLFKPRGKWHKHPQQDWICADTEFNLRFTELFE